MLFHVRRKGRLHWACFKNLHEHLQVPRIHCIPICILAPGSAVLRVGSQANSYIDAFLLFSFSRSTVCEIFTSTSSTILVTYTLSNPKTHSMIFSIPFRSWCLLSIFLSTLFVAPVLASPLALQSTTTTITSGSDRQLEARDENMYKSIPVIIRRRIGEVTVQPTKSGNPKEDWEIYFGYFIPGFVGYLDWQSDPHASNWPWVISRTSAGLDRRTKPTFFVDFGTKDQMASFIGHLKKPDFLFQGRFGFIDAVRKELLKYLSEHGLPVPSIPEHLVSVLEKMLEEEEKVEHTEIAKEVAKYKQSYVEQWDEKQAQAQNRPV
ncbi:hypothetical protein LENED_009894 [Lentinula edodes]|uniref:Uncharacterized protein n=1 Tax=Lentinula edodes TaxID=5353 RepID=A0A1Q3EL85_LENED|nr:hypothetical protein LENED_009894 [Lentinula edodes]